MTISTNFYEKKSEKLTCFVNFPGRCPFMMPDFQETFLLIFKILFQFVKKTFLFFLLRASCRLLDFFPLIQ